MSRAEPRKNKGGKSGNSGPGNKRCDVNGSNTAVGDDKEVQADSGQGEDVRAGAESGSEASRICSDEKALTRTVRIADMTCQMCERKVSKALRSIEGVEDAEVSWIDGTARIRSGREVTDGEIKRALEQAGYKLSENNNRGWLKAYGPVFFLAAAFLILSRLLQGRLGFFSAFPVAGEGAGLMTIFLIGILTSVHCVSMCGGINIGQSVSAAKKGERVLGSNLAYQTGRIISYSLTGGLAGLLGSVLSVNVHVRGLIMAAAGLFMLGMALNIMGVTGTLMRRLMIKYPAPLLRLLGRAGRGRGSFVTGLLNGLMPCGPLQAMQIYALGTGSFVMGMLSMFVFCVGTVPLLLIVGCIGGRLGRRASGMLMKASAALVLAFGIITISNGLALYGAAVPGAGTGTGADYLKLADVANGEGGYGSDGNDTQGYLYADDEGESPAGNGYMSGGAAAGEDGDRNPDTDGPEESKKAAGSTAEDLEAAEGGNEDADGAAGVNEVKGGGTAGESKADGGNGDVADGQETYIDGGSTDAGEAGKDTDAGKDYGSTSKDTGTGKDFGTGKDSGAGKDTESGKDSAENSVEAVSDRLVAVVDGDTQTVSSSMGHGYYEPITVQKGSKASWTLTAPEGSLTGCNSWIYIPEYDIDCKLSYGDNVINFMPEESGTYIFTCWMGMIRSTITVVDEI